jgi:hypothetical protein
VNSETPKRKKYKDLNRKYNGKSDMLTRNTWKKITPITKTTRKHSDHISRAKAKNG